jgi:uncharacterized protein (TIGR03083 family)
MTTKLEFTPWVAPIAGRMARTRAAIIEVARGLPDEAWSRPSPNDGWTYHDLLAHLADDTEKNLHAAVRAVAAGRDIDPALWDDIDSRNARGVRDRRSRSIDELLAEIERDGEAMQELLTQIADEAEHRTQPEIRGTFGTFLRDGLAGHDAFHLAQLRTAVTGATP